MIDWSQIEKYYDQGNTAGFAMSLLESERLLREVIGQKKLPGASLDEKIKLAEKHLTSPHSLHQARHLSQELLNLRLPRNIGKQTAEQVLRVYFTAITELSNLSAVQVGKLKFQYYSLKIKNKILKGALAVMLAAVFLLGVTLLLSDTEAGGKVTETLVNVAHLIVYKFLPVALVVFSIFVIGISVSIKRKGKKSAGAAQTNLKETNVNEELR